jgi:hypothetical protein
MLQPFILIGLGGAGGKTVRAVRQNLTSKLGHLGRTGWPKAWQFIHVDVPTVKDGREFPAPMLPQEDYFSLVPPGVDYGQVHDWAVTAVPGLIARETMRVLPAPLDVNIPLVLGTGGRRGIGRAVVLARLRAVSDRVRQMIEDATAVESQRELAELTRQLGFKVGVPVGSPSVIVISSLAGGAGSGMVIDVAEAIKAAIGRKDATHRIVSLLYAPEVFEELGPRTMEQMAANSMATLSELVAGFWRGALLPSEMSAYEEKGLIVPVSAMSTVGPALNYVVGRRTCGANVIDFGSQHGVYSSAASIITAWMTDARLQDYFSAYVVGGLHAHAASLPDASLLKPSGKGQPLSSLGFARVSLGTEKFFEYAAERIAKQTVSTMLTQHLSTDPERREMKEDQWIEHHANLNERTFFSDTGLIELAEVKGRLARALQLPLDVRYAVLREAIETAATTGMPVTGWSSDGWGTRIVAAYEMNLADLLDAVRALAEDTVREWALAQTGHLVTVVTRTISQFGLPVTVKLLERLAQQCKEAISDLKQERGRHLCDAEALTQSVSQALGAAPGMNAIPRTNPAVAEALERSLSSYRELVDGELAGCIGDVLEDVADTFLAPLITCLGEGLKALRSAASDSSLPDGNVNPFPTWPTFDQTTVDRRFEPAPNEQMLISPEDFPEEFDRLVRDSISDPNLPAHRIVIDQILQGSYLPEVAKLKADDQWRVLAVPEGRGWIPKSRNAQSSTASNQVAQFVFETDPLQYLSLAKKWIRLPGRAFRAYIEQTIVSYLKTSDQAERSRRGKRFTAAMAAAAQASYPLVALDRALLDATHGPIEVGAVCSGIPIDRDDPLYEPIANSLLNNGYNPEKAAKDWFIGEGKGGTAKSIEIFAHPSASMGPIPMTSIMGPILMAWQRVARANPEVQRDFAMMRRTRALREAIPAHPSQWRSMLTGWFMARLLGQLKEDRSGKDFEDAGPRLSVWADGARGHVNFPFPLYWAHTASTIHDYPALILDSLMIALAQCHSTHNLSPLAPYHRLLELGGAGTGQWVELQDWVLTGQPRQGAPMPLADRAGSADMGVEGRREACVAFLESCQSSFDKFLSSLNPNADPRSYPVSWEIRDDIEWAINQAIDACNHVDDGEVL